jgi:hypothetical protein
MRMLSLKENRDKRVSFSCIGIPESIVWPHKASNKCAKVHRAAAVIEEGALAGPMGQSFGAAPARRVIRVAARQMHQQGIGQGVFNFPWFPWHDFLVRRALLWGALQVAHTIVGPKAIL